MKRQIEEDNDTRIMEFIGVSQDKLNSFKSQTSLLKVNSDCSQLVVQHVNAGMKLL